MGLHLSKEYPVAKETFAQADEILGFPLSKIAWDGPEGRLNDTLNTQPALLTHSVAAFRVFLQNKPTFKPAFVAGHSMGELSALVASGALSFEKAVLLTRRRGELMKRAGEVSPGGMAAIIGLDIPVLEEICTRASNNEEIVQVANDNCPGQVVISGHTQALKRAMDLAQESNAPKVIHLNVSIAAHSPLMAIAQVDFNQAVMEASIKNPKIPIIGNVTARPLTSATEIRTDLQAQLNARVRWTETIHFLLAAGIDSFIEFGPGEVISGLVKRIDRKTMRIPLGEPVDFERLVSHS
jgi:[acyl-carrier-protein] S-malonyltransferase